jgi:hypothetical protein
MLQPGRNGKNGGINLGVIMDDKAKIDVLEERVTNWMESTTEYRRDLCRKIDIITNSISKLPCAERKLSTKLLWGAIGITFGIVVAHLGWK